MIPPNPEPLPTMPTPSKSWVLILHNDGRVQAWRDYGTAWGSPVYTVLGYFDGSHRDAMRAARTLAASA